jgi:hypothetical protein
MYNSFPRALLWAGMFNPFGVITERWIFDITIVNFDGKYSMFNSTRSTVGS